MINNTSKNIKFTKEDEHDNKLAFLDLLITKTDNGTLNTEVYRKKTHTDQILNYNSNHPTQHKISCIKTLFNRINTHCNDYPRNCINNVLSRKKQTHTNTKQTEQTKNEDYTSLHTHYI